MQAPAGGLISLFSHKVHSFFGKLASLTHMRQVKDRLTLQIRHESEARKACPACPGRAVGAPLGAALNRGHSRHVTNSPRSPTPKHPLPSRQQQRNILRPQLANQAILRADNRIRQLPLGLLQLQHLLFHRAAHCRMNKGFYRLRKNSCFVSGHDFSRAENNPKMTGFSP
jgi:hypothetical protein